MEKILELLSGIDAETVVQLLKYIAVAVVFICFDILTGLVKAIATKTYKSSVMREGGWHKFLLILAILFGLLLDLAQAIVALPFSLPATLMICLYIIVMEIGSCKENLTGAYNKALPTSVTSVIDDAVEKECGKNGNDQK